MQKIITCDKMKRIDNDTMEHKGMLSAVLMERAALAVVEEIVKHLTSDDKILAVCGSGNNGGDGIAIARLLHLRGYSVSIYLSNMSSKFSDEAQRQRQIADNYGVPVVNNPDFREYTTIVDAIIGIGLSRTVREKIAAVISAINSSGATIWSVDIPSGIDGDTGEILGQAICADYTVTFAYAKPGLYLYPGAGCSGKVYVKDIGIYDGTQEESDIYAPQREDFKWLPDRDPSGNKGTFGKVLVVAGCKNMAGAAYLSARGALLSGAGMVKIHTVEENRVILQQLLPEALLYTDAVKEDMDTKQWEENLNWADVVVTGPGLGQDERAVSLTEFYLKRCQQEKKRLVLDADGLNILSRKDELWKYCGDHVILTPHMGELSRLTGRPVDTLKADILKTVREFASARGITCVAKDARTVVSVQGLRQYLNLSGNNGMATAGSGDVLSGILAGLEAQGLPVAISAWLGVYLHGLAGDAAAKTKNQRSLTASDILDGLIKVLTENEEVYYG